MGDIADQIYDKMLDDEAHGMVCDLHNVWYNSRTGACVYCEEHTIPCVVCHGPDVEECDCDQIIILNGQEE